MSKLYDQYGNHTGSIGDFDGSRAKIYDEYGNHTGYIERSGSSRDKLLDQYGNHTGYIEKSGGSRDKILDEFGNHTGHIERSGGGSSQSSNEYGNHTGYSSSSSHYGSSSSYSPSSGGGAGVGCLTYVIAGAVALLVAVLTLNSLKPGGAIFEALFPEPEIVTTPVFNEKQECGDGVWYLLDEQGNMTISGNGEITRFATKGIQPPWEGFKEYIKTLRIEDGVKGEIPYGAFKDCENLTAVTISGKIRTIEGQAFRNCSSLSQVELPEGVRTVEKQAFGWCDSLKEIVLPSSVETIGYEAFYACSSLESIELGSSLERLEHGTIESCLKLTSIRLPKSLKRLDSADAFLRTSITDIYYEGSENEWKSIEYLATKNTVGDNMDAFAAKGITVHYNAG